MKITCEEQYLQFFFISSRDKKNCAILAIFSAFDTIFYEGIPVIALVTSQSTLKDELCDENSAHRHKLNKYKNLKKFSSSSRAPLQYIVIAFITMRCTGGSMNINLRRSNDHKYKWQRSQIHSIRLPHLTFWGANFCQLKVLVMFCHVEDWGPSADDALIPGWQNLAAFRREQKWQWKVSSSAYIQFLRQMRRFCA